MGRHMSFHMFGTLKSSATYMTARPSWLDRMLICHAIAPSVSLVSNDYMSKDR